MVKRLGIIGTGKSIGVSNDHLKGIRAVPGWELTSIYDLHRDHAEHFAEKNGLSSKVIRSSLDDLLSLVDAVTICTDNKSHAELVREALKRGLPVQCEKPLSRNYAESLALAKEAQEAGVVHYMSMQYRYHPYAQIIKGLIGELGEVYYYRQKLGGARIANPGIGLEWRMQKELSGPGALIDFGVHELDLLHYFLAETCGDITEVQAELVTAIKERDKLDGSGRSQVTNDDMGAIIGRLENGGLVTLNSSRVVPDDGNGLEIVGTRGAIWMDGRGDVYFRGKKPNGAWDQAALVPAEAKHMFPGLARGKQYAEFLDIIENGTSYELDFFYGAQIVRVIDAAVRSSEEGRKVSISEIKD